MLGEKKTRVFLWIILPCEVPRTRPCQVSHYVAGKDGGAVGKRVYEHLEAATTTMGRGEGLCISGISWRNWTTKGLSNIYIESPVAFFLSFYLLAVPYSTFQSESKQQGDLSSSYCCSSAIILGLKVWLCSCTSRHTSAYWFSKSLLWIMGVTEIRRGSCPKTTWWNVAQSVEINLKSLNATRNIFVLLSQTHPPWVTGISKCSSAPCCSHWVVFLRVFTQLQL